MLNNLSVSSDLSVNLETQLVDVTNVGQTAQLLDLREIEYDEEEEKGAQIDDLKDEILDQLVPFYF